MYDKLKKEKEEVEELNKQLQRKLKEVQGLAAEALKAISNE